MSCSNRGASVRYCRGSFLAPVPWTANGRGISFIIPASTFWTVLSLRLVSVAISSAVCPGIDGGEVGEDAFSCAGIGWEEHGLIQLPVQALTQVAP